jgi:hypothetical protein
MKQQQQQQQQENKEDGDTSKQNDKKFTTLTKRQTQLKKLVDDSFSKLRGGVHLGQDRFMREYWMLNKSGGVYIESSPLVLQEDKKKQEEIEIKEEEKVIKKEETQEEIVLDLSCKKSNVEEKNDKEDVVVEPKVEIKDLNDLIIVQNTTNNQTITNDYESHQQLQLNLNSKLLSTLTYKNMEILILDYLQHKNEQTIDKSIYMNGTWWVIDEKKLVQQLENCLAKRGFREQMLAKNLLLHREQLNEDETYKKMKNRLESDENDVINENSVSVAASKNRLLTTQDDYEDILDLNEKKFKQSERDLLDAVYSLEDRIFSANLQSKYSKNDFN